MPDSLVLMLPSLFRCIQIFVQNHNDFLNLRMTLVKYYRNILTSHLALHCLHLGERNAFMRGDVACVDYILYISMC